MSWPDVWRPLLRIVGQGVRALTGLHVSDTSRRAAAKYSSDGLMSPSPSRIMANASSLASAGISMIDPQAERVLPMLQHMYGHINSIVPTDMTDRRVLRRSVVNVRTLLEFARLSLGIRTTRGWCPCLSRGWGLIVR